MTGSDVDRQLDRARALLPGRRGASVWLIDVLLWVMSSWPLILLLVGGLGALLGVTRGLVRER